MFNLSRFSTGFVVGFGAGFISRDLMSSGPSVVKPVIKGFMKAGVTILEKSRESIASFAETLEDLLAEVRSEQVTPTAPQKKTEKKASPATPVAASEPAQVVKPAAAQKA